MNQRKQAIIAKFDQLPANSKEFVMACMTAIIDRNPTPLEQLRDVHAENAELVEVINDALQHIGRKQAEVRS